MTVDTFDKTIDKIQATLVWFVVGIITVCIAVLILFDPLAGTGTMLYLTGGKDWQSAIISLATTGLLFALMFIGYMLTENKNSLIKAVGKIILIVSGILYIQDIIFDSLLADILRYEVIKSHTEIDNLQWMFRFLIGGISTVGEALSVAMIVGMPVLKSILRATLGIDSKDEKPATNHEKQHQHNHHINREERQRHLESKYRQPEHQTHNQIPKKRSMEREEYPTYHPIAYKDGSEVKHNSHATG